jgi:hypothetical protein
VNPFLPIFLKRLTDEYQAVKVKTGKPYDYLSCSVLAKKRRQYIPIAQVPSPNQDTSDVLDRKENGMKNFYPWFVTKYNSAQNEGHANIMLKLLATCRIILSLGLYPFLRMDITLYMQWLRVIFFTKFDFLW